MLSMDGATRPKCYRLSVKLSVNVRDRLLHSLLLSRIHFINK